jgi:membrane associated rhomboid family serine protease
LVVFKRRILPINLTNFWLFLAGKLIEPLWGTREMLYFFVIVNLSAAILSVGYYLFLYAVTFDPSILFDVTIHGLSGYIAAVSVAVRQIMPDHVLFRTPAGKITNRYIKNLGTNSKIDKYREDMMKLATKLRFYSYSIS